MRKMSVLLVLALGVGCASGPKYAEIEGQIPPVPSDKGRIFVYRAGSMFGAAIQPAVFLNDEKVGSSIPGGFFFLDRSPGNFEVKCATETDHRVTFTLAARETLYVQTTMAMGFFVGHAIPKLVDPQDGKAGVRKCSYTGTEWTPAGTGKK